MKLKNKKTGEIGYPYFQNWKDITCVIVDENGIQIAEYTHLAELNADWEDYEEPKRQWCISDNGKVYGFSEHFVDSQIEDDHREIGNLFETKEEAEKAVEKLKAWKRLKDKGFRQGITGKCDNAITYGITITFSDYYGSDEIRADLDLLFGGEE